MNRAVRNISELKVSTNRYSFIILASSYNSKFKSIGPCSLAPVTDKLDLIDLQLSYIKHVFSGAEIILIAGYEADKLIKAVSNDVIKVEYENYSEFETVRSLEIGLRAATREHIVFLYGNVAFEREALKNIGHKPSILVNDHQQNNFNIGCCVNDNVVENLYYDLPNKWAGIATISGKELNILRDFTSNRNKDNLFLFEALNYVISKGGKFLASRLNCKTIPIAAPCDLELIRKFSK